jgi:hypothetical protein
MTGRKWTEEVPVALSALDDKSHTPRPAELREVLGRAFDPWTDLLERLSEAFGPLGRTWNFAGANWGWSLKLARKKRTVLYLTPCREHFLVGFALGEKAVEKARASRLPGAVQAVIDGAKKYAEGRAVRLTIRRPRDLPAVIKIAAAKMSA